MHSVVDSSFHLGRNTSGVKVMECYENVEVASTAKVRREA